MSSLARLGPIAGIALTVACGPGQPGAAAPSSPPVAPSDDEAVLVAVFLHELRDFSPGQTEICLRVRPNDRDVGDASDAVLAGVRRRFPEARKASECAGGGPNERVRVKSTGAKAVMCDIGPVRRDGPDRAVVGGGGASGGGTWVIREVDYDVVREGGAWRVKSERVTRQT